MTMPTLDDALRALRSHAGVHTPHASSDLGVIQEFLTQLSAAAEPELLVKNDYDGGILDGAHQGGFKHIDDNGQLYIIHADDLIKYVHANREGAAVAALQNAAREALPPVMLSNQDTIELGRLVNEFANVPIFGEGRLRKDVMADLKKLMGIGLEAARSKSPHDVCRTTEANLRADLLSAMAALSWTRAKDKPLDPLAPGLVVKAWDAPAGHPPSFWAGRPSSSATIKTLSCDWYLQLPELPPVP